MNRTESAIKILDAQGAYCGQCSREPGDSLNACRDCAAVLETYANALEAAGLLAPDLPEPEPYGELAEFGDEKVITGRGTSTVSLYIDDFQMSSDSARELALMLLAAADYAEKEQGNE